MYIPLQFSQYEKQALLDTGAIQSAMSETEQQKILTTQNMALIKEMHAPEFKMQIANVNIEPVRK